MRRPLISAYTARLPLSDSGQYLRESSQDVVDAVSNHGLHRLVDVEGVGDLGGVGGRGRQRDRSDRTAGHRHHQTVWFAHLVVVAGQWDLFTLAGHDGGFPRPAGAHVEYRGARFGRQPPFEAAGLRQGLPDPLARRVQPTRHGELTHRNLPELSIGTARREPIRRPDVAVTDSLAGTRWSGEPF